MFFHHTGSLSLLSVCLSRHHDDTPEAGEDLVALGRIHEDMAELGLADEMAHDQVVSPCRVVLRVLCVAGGLCGAPCVPSA